MNLYATPNVSDHDFICEVEAEVNRARSKFPATADMAMALVEEVGELCQKMIQQKHEPGKGVTHEEVWGEAVQVAVMAMRLATEGQHGFPYHPESGYRGQTWPGYKGHESLT